MSIFGEERKIKFKKNGTDVLVDHCVILRSEPEPKTILHESIINRHREWIDIYNHHIVECIVYLCKYADPNAAYQNFLQYEGALVDSLYEYIDGLPFYDENYSPAKFWFEKIKPRYIETDEYPDELRFTFKSEKTIIGDILLLPSDIEDLFLWFNDDTLSSPSTGNFIWTDKVTGDIQLSGNYGSGSGLTEVNGYNILDVGNGSNFENQLNEQFYLTEETTFVGVIHNNYPSLTERFICHYWEQLDFPVGAYLFDFKQDKYIASGTDPVGLKHNIAITSAHEIGFESNPPIDPDLIPYIPTFFAVRMNNVTGVRLKLNDYDYSNSFGFSITKPIDIITINKQYYGKIYEFLIYRRELTDDEIAILKNYYSKKYNLLNI